MGYGVSSYRVDIAKVEHAFGHLDSAERNQIIQCCAEPLEDLDELFEEDFSALDVLKDYLDGKVSYPDAASQYWYVFEQLCRYYGEWLNNNQWSPASIEVFSQLPSLKFYNLIHKFLPSPDDFPSVYFCPRDKHAALREELKNCDASVTQVLQFSSWLNDELDLVLFYY